MITKSIYAAIVAVIVIVGAAFGIDSRYTSKIDAKAADSTKETSELKLSIAKMEVRLDVLSAATTVPRAEIEIREKAIYGEIQQVRLRLEAIENRRQQ